MHEPILDYLEEYLGDPGDPSIPPEFHAHLRSCPSCKSEVGALSTQASLLHALRPPADLEPVPGFYARVLNRVEDRSADSFWSPFLDPRFGKRLSIACAALVLLIGTYIVSTEPSEHFASPTGVVSVPDTTFTFGDGSTQPQQRDAVLTSFETFRE